MFLRKSRLEPLPVTMSAVRMGERVLQVGIDDAAIAAAIAAKVGLSGSAAIAVADESAAARAQSATAKAGLLVDIKVTTLSALPFDDEAFDLIVVHAARGLLAPLDPGARASAMREWHRVLRHGGRVMTIEPGTATGLGSMFKQSRGAEPSGAGAGMVAALRSAGFRSARMLADREGLKFAEGIKN
jgi:ubiquinone/menaquinone biosynthesis C-methylase UbiE